MKDIKNLGPDLDKLTHKLEQKLINAQSKTADKIKKDVIKNTGFGRWEIYR